MPDRAPVPNLRTVFDEHARYVIRTLRHFGVKEADVEDVAQEVFVTVHRKLPEFEGRSKLRTWLYSICLRVASDYRRRAYVVRERPTSSPPVDDGERSGAEPDATLESRAFVQKLLEALDDDKRAVLVLYEIEGLTMREVAEVIGCPLQTAYSRLHAARDLLREAWQQSEKDSP
ncbi:MAG: polymerase sigma factor RpoE [Polyangiaceae bacterium]|jgi:RNA polymerase sigma-70 factor (ECF subfamily)|nr:polymerase sigma factor RpoE [Polyangiaceae bacterium]